jgi:hypothetical protein
LYFKVDFAFVIRQRLLFMIEQVHLVISIAFVAEFIGLIRLIKIIAEIIKLINFDIQFTNIIKVKLCFVKFTKINFKLMVIAFIMVFELISFIVIPFINCSKE